MKKLIIAFLFIPLLVLNMYGQDYQSVNSNRLAYFEDINKNIRAIKIDSVQHESESILYPYRNIHQIDYDCYSPTKFSWMGSEIHINENGDNLFFNKKGEKITLKTKAVLDEQWIAFQIQDSLTIEARVVKQDTLHFLGLVDSVKVIAFQAYDKDANPLDYKVNNMPLIISKNHGLIQTVNFITFPERDPNSFNEIFEAYHLVGLSNPEVGIQNLTKFDIFDFNTDDELHISTTAWDGPGEYNKSDKAIYKYLERIDYTDSLVYRYARKQEIIIKNGGVESYYFYNDTLKLVVPKDPLFDKLPEEPISSEHTTFSYSMRNDDVLSKIDASSYHHFNAAEGSCWSPPITNGCFSANIYLKSLGGPYYSCINLMSGSSKELTYYKKGDKTWGVPLTITGIEKTETNNQIKLYPNPIKDGKLYIHFDQIGFSACKIDIIDINGRVIKSEVSHSLQTTLDLSELSKGIYMYKIADNNGLLLKTGKVIIE